MDHPARQYDNPALTAAEERDLLRCDYLLLGTGQAALGLIGPDLLGIAVEPRPGAVVLHFAVTAYTAEVAADLDDLVDALTVFLAGGPEQNAEITAVPHVGPPDASWPGHRHAPLYLAKPPPG